jgi:hypothetical protein
VGELGVGGNHDELGVQGGKLGESSVESKDLGGADDWWISKVETDLPGGGRKIVTDK